MPQHLSSGPHLPSLPPLPSPLPPSLHSPPDPNLTPYLTPSSPLSTLSIDSSPSFSSAHTPPLDALPSPSSSISEEPPLTTSSYQSQDASHRPTCVVCMDNRTDIALSPCQHSHCCLECFQRSHLRRCPICRSCVTSVVVLDTNIHLPVALIAPPPGPPDPPHHTPNLRPTHRSLRPHSPSLLPMRRSMPVLTAGLQDNLFSMRSRAASMSSMNVAQQAQSSMRSLPRSQHAAFRQLRETGSVTSSRHSHDRSFSSFPAGHTFRDAMEVESPSPAISESEDRSFPHRNLVLVGHCRKMMVSLAQSLEAIFPPRLDDGRTAKPKSTLYINDEPIRLVLIESPLFSMEPQLVSRIQRHSPKLVLLCADFFNVSSFESIVRVDMEMLDYLNVSCVWVLVKSLLQRKTSNFVEEADVRTAKHFLSKSRSCFVAQVDGPLQGATVRKLGAHVYRSVSGISDSAPVPSNFSQRAKRSPPRSFSFFCIRPPRKMQKRDHNKSTSNLARWLF